LPVIWAPQSISPRCHENVDIRRKEARVLNSVLQAFIRDGRLRNKHANEIIEVLHGVFAKEWGHWQCNIRNILGISNITVSCRVIPIREEIDRGEHAKFEIQLDISAMRAWERAIRDSLALSLKGWPGACGHEDRLGSGRSPSDKAPVVFKRISTIWSDGGGIWLECIASVVPHSKRGAPVLPLPACAR
jgi:hypothetical protein